MAVETVFRREQRPFAWHLQNQRRAQRRDGISRLAGAGRQEGGAAIRGAGDHDRPGRHAKSFGGAAARRLANGGAGRNHRGKCRRGSMPVAAIQSGQALATGSYPVFSAVVLVADIESSGKLSGDPVGLVQDSGNAAGLQQAHGPRQRRGGAVNRGAAPARRGRPRRSTRHRRDRCRGCPQRQGDLRSSTATSVPDVPSTASAPTRARSTDDGEAFHRIVERAGPHRGILRDPIAVATWRRHGRRSEGHKPSRPVDGRDPHAGGADVDAKHEIAHGALRSSDWRYFSASQSSSCGFVLPRLRGSIGSLLARRRVTSARQRASARGARRRLIVQQDAEPRGRRQAARRHGPTRRAASAAVSARLGFNDPGPEKNDVVRDRAIRAAQRRDWIGVGCDRVQFVVFRDCDSHRPRRGAAPRDRRAGAGEARGRAAARPRREAVRPRPTLSPATTRPCFPSTTTLVSARRCSAIACPSDAPGRIYGTKAQFRPASACDQPLRRVEKAGDRNRFDTMHVDDHPLRHHRMERGFDRRPQRRAQQIVADEGAACFAGRIAGRKTLEHRGKIDRDQDGLRQSPPSSRCRSPSPTSRRRA